MYDNSPTFRMACRQLELAAEHIDIDRGILEGAIRERPEQWVWYHRRWKTAPPQGDEVRNFSKKRAYPMRFQRSKEAVSIR